jgi:hypothetical protein
MPHKSAWAKAMHIQVRHTNGNEGSYFMKVGRHSTIPATLMRKVTDTWSRYPLVTMDARL